MPPRCLLPEKSSRIMFRTPTTQGSLTKYANDQLLHYSADGLIVIDSLMMFLYANHGDKKHHFITDEITLTRQAPEVLSELVIDKKRHFLHFANSLPLNLNSEVETVTDLFFNNTNLLFSVRVPPVASPIDYRILTVSFNNFTLFVDVNPLYLVVSFHDGSDRYQGFIDVTNLWNEQIFLSIRMERGELVSLHLNRVSIPIVVTRDSRVNVLPSLCFIGSNDVVFDWFELVAMPANLPHYALNEVLDYMSLKYGKSF